MVQAEVGAVAAGSFSPLLAGLVQVAGDQVDGVGPAASGKADVQGRGVGQFGDDDVAGIGGLALHAVAGGGVGQVDVLSDVVGRELAGA